MLELREGDHKHDQMYRYALGFGRYIPNAPRPALLVRAPENAAAFRSRSAPQKNVPSGAATLLAVCFSPEGDLVGGIVVTAIGVDACRHAKGRNTHLLLATVPLLLGAHQIDESLVWWGLQGHVPQTLWHVAMWIYLVIALVVVPIVVPLAILRLEPTKRRRRLIAPFVALGTGVGIVLLLAMLHGPVTAHLASYHLSYSIGLKDGILVVGLYVVATCGSLLASGYKDVVIFGIANLVAVIVLAKLTADGFASLWCFYAAVASGAISLHMRFGKPHRAQPYVLT